MNATPKFIAWLWDGSDCWAPQILNSEALASLRERAQEATGGNIEVHAYPLHAHDAMREALALSCAKMLLDALAARRQALIDAEKIEPAGKKKRSK